MRKYNTTTLLKGLNRRGLFSPLVGRPPPLWIAGTKVL
jgi:hypothetical protein